MRAVYFGALIILCITVSCKKNTSDPEPLQSFYAKGADISWATEMEDKNMQFYNADGKSMECTALFKEIGFNAVRYRVWVNPTEGYCNKEDVLRKAKIAQSLGMKIMIDFHYSDWWADPGKQNKPEAWKILSLDDLEDAVEDHTEDVLEYLKENGIEVTWVQVGNEVTNGMLWETCRVQGNDAKNFVRCFNAGAEAVKDVYPNAHVILHVDNAWNYDTLKWFYDLVNQAGAKYDIIGLSLYPSYWDSASKAYPDWHTKTGLAISNFSLLHTLYGKPVMLVEFGMPASLPDESKVCLQTLVDSTKDKEWFKGIFLWEPESEKSRNNYEYGAFSLGKPTKALDPFKN